ncbi:MAG: hypothetical protein ACREQZ_14565 [Woeseiaceae bacterium]
MNEEMRSLERKSRAAFDESVESLDAATRSRLARARARALEELHRRRLSWSVAWVPVGAAAAALVAVMLWQGKENGDPPPDPALAALEDLDMMAGGEDFDMLDEDEGFYVWAAQEMSDGVG